MSEYLKELQEKHNLLKEKYRKKCEALKKANARVGGIIRMEDRYKWWSHIRNIKLGIAEDLTAHLDRHVYCIDYNYHGKIYSEEISSFGSKWLMEELLCHLSRKKSVPVRSFDVDVVKIVKLY